MKCKIPEEEYEVIVNLYQSGYSKEKLEKSYNAKQFLDWIYQDAELFIDRKYNTYLDICKKVNNSLSA